jgi:hypothetical protein
MIRLTRLSNLEIIEEDKLKTSGPTNRQANNNKHDRFLDFSIFC